MRYLTYLCFIVLFVGTCHAVAHEPDCNHESLEEARSRDSGKHTNH